MKSYEIHLSDWKRIVFGTAPASFLIEIIFRTIIVYVILLIVMRLMGKRMSGKLNTTEVAVMITLGGIVSVPMQVPERGILQGIVILICALIFERFVNRLGVKSSRFERTIRGNMNTIVKDGIIQVDALIDDRMSRNQLKEKLRQMKVYNIGSIQRAYLESSGSVSVFKFRDERPGLCTLPETDYGVHTIVRETGDMACNSCGHVEHEEHPGTCKVCGTTHWKQAVIEIHE